MGVDHVTDRIEFQKKVLNDKGSLSNRIDAYIPETRVLIEQKSRGIDLSKPQPGHNNKTPYEQAMSPKSLQYLMGHSDIGVTLNVYTHLGLEDAKAELERLFM